jgi:acyl dehydratase
MGGRVRNVEGMTMGDETEHERVVRSLDELKALLGQEIAVGQWVELTQDLVDRFVEATAVPSIESAGVDRSDPTATGSVVPGYFLLSAGAILGRGRQGITIDLGGKLSVNYGMNRVRFPAPVHVGQRVRLRTTLLNIEEIDHRAIQITRLQTIEIEGERELACVAETLGRVYF